MVQRISVEEAVRLMEQAAPVLIDCRDAHAYEADRIGAALHLTEALLMKLRRGGDRDRILLLYCYHGNISQDYARLFRDFGFRQVMSLDGGYEAWRQRNAASRRDEAPQALSLSEETLSWLEQHRCDPRQLNDAGPKGVAPLVLACREGRSGIVGALLAAGADPNLTDADGNSALWAACYAGDADTLQRLIRAGVDLDQQNPDGATVLIYAASSGKSDMVRLLLQAGADPGLRARDDFTALDLTADAASLRLLRAAEVAG